ncbi:hypothetical protein AA103196_1470 [Ameyamaea chiangmaiensis NBRC 103196]|uniref:DUF333 domain-containing protein n=1 Tax=Ameyamaea chiangmaiensis TaxID=442969 RepID=A0A850PI79_9PROT|nr:DUF333 domain-containing protein [Ameyamaea chiangmaiensis]MBS4075291.1 DUF333 domain-containing protein [Ameyamaea chiangmaiensis]NVN41512.1 DUF333 domain-containing protein [Ameyamaea chiangmaiensis]GBQ66669.1 hypothetical protein AA103196_1470 [Ameyamaea chiangmaiensis NBRC 103196]
MKPFLTLAALAPLGACASAAGPTPIGMPNPASAYCVKLGGTLDIRKDTGGEAGYCHLPDGRVVEEWALFRSARRSHD